MLLVTFNYCSVGSMFIYSISAGDEYVENLARAIAVLAISNKYLGLKTKQ